MSDRELMEMAAKAAGITVKRSRLDDPMHSDFLIANSPRNSTSIYGAWNSLTDDGDALRLAVKLNLFNGPNFYHFRSLERFAGQDADDMTATRRAITRAAAELGKGMV